MRHKDYGFDPADWARDTSNRQALFRADMNGRLAGVAAISESWCGMAEIGEISVNRACRTYARAGFILGECGRLL
ncbi:hypothetical protein LFL97_22220 [Burkholderia sp. JSH-S8]|nr:hypothetical protein LFL97_22220 [Burkholderia sp. JSH-S8]